MPADLFETFGVAAPPRESAAAEASASGAGRDLFREFDVPAQPGAPSTSGGGRDLFSEFGVRSAKNEGGLLDTVRGMFKQFWSGGGRSVMDDYQPGPAARAAEEASPVAPLNARTYRTVEQQVDLMTPDQRAAAEARPDVLGTAVRDIVAKDKERAGRLMTTTERVTGDRLDERAARLRVAGMDSDVAQRQAAADIALGMDSSRQPASVKPSDFEGFDQTGLGRVWNDYSSGVVGSTGGTLAYAGRKLGIPDLQDIGDSMTRYAERITPTRQTFGDKLVSAVGSMASFYVPGVGVQKGTVALAALSPVAAKWAGAGTMAALEAAGEANSVYESNVRSGQPEAQAAKRADLAFFLNLGLLSVTDRFGLFNDLNSVGKRIAVAAATEGPGQEGPQQVIQNYFTGQPLMEGVGEASAIGAMVGGGARGVHSALTMPAAGTETRQGAPATMQDRQTAAPMPESALAARESPAATELRESVTAQPAAGAQQTGARDLFQEFGIAAQLEAAPTAATAPIEQPGGIPQDTSTPVATRLEPTSKSLADITVKVQAIEAETGRKVVLDEKADIALRDVDDQLEKGRMLREGLRSGSLSKVMNRLGLSEYEAEALRRATKSYVDADFLSGREAATLAVEDHIEQIQAERADIAAQVEQQGGTVRTASAAGVGRDLLQEFGIPPENITAGQADQASGAGEAPSAPGEQNRFADRLQQTGEATTTARGEGSELMTSAGTLQDESAGQAGPDELAAARGVVMTPAYAGAAVGTGQPVTNAAQARPDAIRQAIRKLFNVPINEGHFKLSRDTLGIYKIKPQTIRIQNQNDIGVIAHETGHHFSETSRTVRTIMKAHENELRTITPYAAGQKRPALQREEGFAEYLRFLWTDPQQAQQRAPGFSKAFDQYVDQNGHRKAFDIIGTAIRDWQNLPPADRILAKVGATAERASAADVRDRFIFEVLDKWVPLRRMVAELKPDIVPSKDPFKAAHLLAGDAAVIEDWITSQAVPFDPVKRADPKNYGKPLRAILEPVAHDLKPFSAYLIARRAGELMEHGKEHLYTPEEIRAGLRLETPEFKQAAEEVYDYNNRLIEYAVDGGLLSPAIADRLRQYTAYVPFFRESEEGSRHGGGKNPFKRIFGGTENLRDPVANLVQNTANIIYATNRNAVLAKAFALAKEVPGGGRWLEQIPIPDAVLNVPKRTILEAFEKQGVVLDSHSAAALAQIQKLIVPSPVEDKGERIVIVRINGEPKALQVNNKLLWKALQSFEPADLGIVEKVLSVPSDLLRAGVTLSPDFMARNFMRDTLSGFIQSKAGILPVTSTMGGFKEVATRSDVAKLYRAFGGAYADLWKGDSQQTAKILARMAKRGKFDPRTILTPVGVLRALHALGSISEAGTRVGEFKKTAKAGGVDALIAAAYNAREVSVDFGVHGANPAVRLLTRITPFLNPAMQGMAKGVRSGREQFARTLFRGAFLTAFSVALYMLNRDADWYDELEQWERNVYWHFDVGLRDKDGQVIPLRLPKPFEWGAIFGSVPEALTQLAIEQRGKDFGRRLLSVWNDVFALRAAPTALLVPAEIWANKNTFTDRAIVPEAKERLDPALQHGNSASITARALGEATDTSPAQIDHVVRGFFGTMGVYATMLADLVARQFGDYPEGPAKTWRQMPVVRAFVHDPDNPNSRYITDFYNLLKEARQREASLRRAYEGTPREGPYKEQHGDLIDITPDANKVARDLSGLRKDNEEIRADRDYTSDEKRGLINENNRAIKRTAKDFMLDAIRQGVR
ncbi:MAG: hypothetical protein HY661_19295 [Betaproteobacteria bacterium]|nr:hypothetical protein [Betaproteobacteria bacterium]